MLTKRASDKAIRVVCQLLVSRFGRSGFRLMFAASVVPLIVAACAEPLQGPAGARDTVPPELNVEILAMDDTLCVGNQTAFVIRTTPANECLGAVGYWTSKGSWETSDFETMTADEQGICRWNWEVPGDAAPGMAEFRAGVRGYGDLHSLMPQSFQILECE